MTDPKPLTAGELAELRRLHVPLGVYDPIDEHCQECGYDDRWPCDVARLLATLDAATQPAPVSGEPTTEAE